MSSLRKIPLPHCFLAGFILLIVGALILDQKHWWDLRDDYLFGYLVPLFIGWIVYERWGLIRYIFTRSADSVSTPEAKQWVSWIEETRPETVKQGFWEKWFDGGAMFVAFFGFVWILFAALYRAMEGPNLVTSQLLVMGYTAMLFSGVYVFSDRRFDGERIACSERLKLVSLFVFPALIWFLSAPMFNFIEKSISTFLLNKVAFSVFHVFDFLGLAIVQEGNVLILPNGSVGVEDACSGIRSLMACLFAGSFLAAVCLPLEWKDAWKKVLMVMVSMVLAFVMNIGRSLFLTTWAYNYGSDAIGDDVVIWGIDLGTVHDLTGFAVIAPVVIGLLLLLPVFTFKWEIPMGDLESGGPVQMAKVSVTIVKDTFEISTKVDFQRCPKVTESSGNVFNCEINVTTTS